MNKELWVEFYKIGISNWQLIDRPKVYDNDGEVPEDIHNYAYWFAESFLNNYESKFKKPEDYRYDVWEKDEKIFVVDVQREKPEICECFNDEDSSLICELLNRYAHST